MSVKQIQEYIERLSNLLRTEFRRIGAIYGLQPIQLEALHYLSICNRYSDTPKGVTEYFGQTKGTVSQSLKVLERKGFVTKHPDGSDGRITHLKVTKDGRAVLKKSIPAPLLSKSGQCLIDGSMHQIQNNLKELLRAIQKSNGLRSFGVCQTCRYNQQKEDGTYLCGLTKEVLSSKDIQRICREHEHPEAVIGI